MTKTAYRYLTIPVFLAILALPAWKTAHAQEMICPEHTSVDIDIKPGSYPNAINLSERGWLPVAIISTADFDASLFNPEMAHLMDASSLMSGSCQGASAVRWQWDDVNRDEIQDIVFFFRVQDLPLTSTSTTASLMAHGSYGDSTLYIMGTDSVKVVLK